MSFLDSLKPEETTIGQSYSKKKLEFVVMPNGAIILAEEPFSKYENPPVNRKYKRGHKNRGGLTDD